MKIVELKCDFCGKIAKGNDHHFDLPTGWFVLGFHCQTFVDPNEWRATHHFCSSICFDNSIEIKRGSNIVCHNIIPDHYDSKEK